MPTSVDSPTAGALWCASVGEATPDPTTFETPDPGIAAALVVLAIIVAVAIFEVWALRTRHNTISHMIQRVAHRRAWFKWLLGATMFLLTWHILWGL